MLQSLKKEAMQTGISSLRDIIDYPHIFPDNAYYIQVERLKTLSFSLRHHILNLDLLILKILPRCYKQFHKLTHRNLKRLYSSIRTCSKNKIQTIKKQKT